MTSRLCDDAEHNDGRKPDRAHGETLDHPQVAADLTLYIHIEDASYSLSSQRHRGCEGPGSSLACQPSHEQPHSLYSGFIEFSEGCA